MQNHHFQPTVKRSKLRLWLGRYFYILKRRWDWLFSGIKFSTEILPDRLPIPIFTHQSILMRQLKDVDMWLQYNKVNNLHLAIARINGLVIQPEEVFSFWYLVGNPTKRRGFKLGMVLDNGKVSAGYGGGLCLLANLIYWMTLHSPLSIKERWRHSYDVFPDVNRTLPFGSGATVSYNYIDLQIENKTPHKYQFCLWLTDEHLFGEIRSDLGSLYKYEILERNHLITGPIAGQYIRQNQIFRKIYDFNTNQLLDEEFVTENCALMMYSPLLSAGK
ncbi:MAG: vancomycin resistance protein [Pseudanabaena frigida]|uniref:Vancomycin resistance protein n=1 Tax=Pseudanabaena frigida TaxID=945775 RepID=A0A2W4Y6X5_9CYAN|nr:MAG: vancomycin resistance protein [Pseudanabaena frigida]